jgi:hypothetical protein
MAAQRYRARSEAPRSMGYHEKIAVHLQTVPLTKSGEGVGDCTSSSSTSGRMIMEWKYVNCGTYEGWMLVGANGPGGTGSTDVLVFKYVKFPPSHDHRLRFKIGELYVYCGDGTYSEQPFDNLEEAQAWAYTTWRMNYGGKQ